MLNKIKILLQKPSLSWNKDFSSDFNALLNTCKNLTRNEDGNLVLQADNLKPVTEIAFHDRSTIVKFEDESKVEKRFLIKGLTIAINSNEVDKAQINDKVIKILKDEVGEYCKVAAEIGEYNYQLTMRQLLNRFEGKILEVNHCGINFSPDSITRSDYTQLKTHISKQSFLVNYPTGEEWPFIIPSTNIENINGITNTSLIRHPLFEFVYSEYNKIPVIQFDIRPNLTKEEVLRLLPDPYGISFPGLEDSIRTVYVLSDIKGLIIRFDIGLRSKSNNSFYPWMIEQGGRC
jgi:hypothetical protein